MAPGHAPSSAGLLPVPLLAAGQPPALTQQPLPVHPAAAALALTAALPAGSQHSVQPSFLWQDIPRQYHQTLAQP